MGLRDLEPHGNAKGSDGFFHKGILQAMESEHIGAGSLREVKVVANGHCHGMFFNIISQVSADVLISRCFSHGELSTRAWCMELLRRRRVRSYMYFVSNCH